MGSIFLKLLNQSMSRNYKTPRFWLIILSIVVIVIIGACFMTNPIGSSTEYSGLEDTQSVEESKTGSYEHKSFEEVKSYLKIFSNDSDSLEKEGCFISVHGVNEANAANIWNAFIQKVNEQESAEIVFAQFTDEGDAVLNYVEYNGTDYYHVCDSSRDAFMGTGERYYEETFPYLKLYEQTNDNGDNQEYIVLTTEKDLSFERFYQIYYDDSREVSSSFEYRLLLTYVVGNENANVTGEESWNEVSYSYDMSKILIPLEQIAKIEVISGNTGKIQTFYVIDSSNGFKDILELYENLDVAPDEEIEIRSGYSYRMLLYDENNQLLQDVTPYKDAVCIDGTMYDGQLNGTTTNLLLNLDSLEW